MLFVVLASTAAVALPIAEACEAIADRLVAKQGPDGAWPGEPAYTGTIAAGLARAYEVTGKAEYRTAAELGGVYIINSAGGNFYGDEAYGLSLLTDVSGDPIYADAARNFYDQLDTVAYISGFSQAEPSSAVFHVAQHTVAAHKVGAKDAGIWREALIQYLSWVDDDVAEFPVLSLGVATWALAQTGPMDDTRIDPFGLGERYWTGAVLSDLPNMLVGHQDFSSLKWNGSFYYRFDHEAAPHSSGYTEDTVYGVLGLIEANKADPNLDFASACSSLRG